MHPAKFCGDACRSSATGARGTWPRRRTRLETRPAVARRHGSGPAAASGPARYHGCRRHPEARRSRWSPVVRDSIPHPAARRAGEHGRGWDDERPRPAREVCARTAGTDVGVTIACGPPHKGVPRAAEPASRWRSPAARRGQAQPALGWPAHSARRARVSGGRSRRAAGRRSWRAAARRSRRAAARRSRRAAGRPAVRPPTGSVPAPADTQRRVGAGPGIRGLPRSCHRPVPPTPHRRRRPGL